MKATVERIRLFSVANGIAFDKAFDIWIGWLREEAGLTKPNAKEDSV